MSEKKKSISKVYLFKNTAMAVFDSKGEQVGELQSALIVDWAEKAKVSAIKSTV